MMYQRPTTLSMVVPNDENTNPMAAEMIQSKDPIKPISLHPSKPVIGKKTNTTTLLTTKEDTAGMRTALSSIVNRVKMITRPKKPEDLKKVSNESTNSSTSTAALAATTTTSNQDSENKDPQLSSRTSQAASLSTEATTSSNNNSTNANNEPSTCSQKQSMACTPQKKTTEFFTSPGIDKADANDPQSCVEYVKDIHSHLKKIETKYRADPTYLSKQSIMRHKHRFTVVNWMIEMHQKFQLNNATLFLAVNLLDRFLSLQDVPLKSLQLLAATCMFVAAKYEELQYPVSAEIVEISSHVFSKDELLKMERILLKELDFNITVATVYPFLKRYSKCARCDFNQLALAYYLAELSLLEEASLYYLPSQIASACIYIAGRLCQKKNSWDDVLHYYTGYTEQDIEPCASVIVKIARKYSSNDIKTCTRTKYSQEEKAKVAWIVMSYFNRSNQKSITPRE
ncbi:hypothetical protein C9374_010926 [Naegleria lovaniensis]|uniref:Uncharacterized protein n=1 Tax=Naegleria lovaniensis TaxID=51637 RepID=A0AA88GHS0_NAELO|nr:uncharacterized protein C9374_010926 [Naegleria lovaniensis]KAG2374356.1 hypothetical protein C9374_010926 [Naegleria lovaniensis]